MVYAEKKVVGPRLMEGTQYTLAQLHDGTLFAGMSEALAAFAAAREQGRTVAVVGDYDVDGVTSTALLLEVSTPCEVEDNLFQDSRVAKWLGRCIHQNGS